MRLDILWGKSWAAAVGNFGIPFGVSPWEYVSEAIFRGSENRVGSCDHGIVACRIARNHPVGEYCVVDMPRVLYRIAVYVYPIGEKRHEIR